MDTITIPKKIAAKGDLVIIPRKEYEALLALKKIREFSPTLSQEKALRKAESNLQRGETLSYNELIKALGIQSLYNVSVISIKS